MMNTVKKKIRICTHPTEKKNNSKLLMSDNSSEENKESCKGLRLFFDNMRGKISNYRLRNL